MSEEHQYISLSQASQYCDYSQEYLSLRARQKKLQAKKIGRNWVTTRKWLQEYIFGATNYKDNVVQKPHTSRVQKREQVVISTRIPNFPPTNLPVSNSLLLKLRSQTAIDRYRYLVNLQQRIGIVFSLTALMIMFILNMFVWGGEISAAMQNVDQFSYTITKSFDEGFTSASFSILFEIDEIKRKVSIEYPASVGTVGREYIIWIKATFISLGSVIVHLVKD